MKLDLDDLERKADAALQTWWLRGRDTTMVVGNDSDGGPRHGSAGLHLGPANVDHIAANSPPVTLALIARIRELEQALRSSASVIEGTVQAEIQHDGLPRRYRLEDRPSGAAADPRERRGERRGADVIVLEQIRVGDEYRYRDEATEHVYTAVEARQIAEPTRVNYMPWKPRRAR